MIRKPLIRKIVALGAASSVTVGMSLLGVGAIAAHATNGVQPVNFSVSSGSLVLAEAPTTTITLTPGTANHMPATTVTDGTNVFGRGAAWSATNIASDLNESGGATIVAAQIAITQTSGSFTSGSGVDTASSPGSVVVTGDSINSVYTYTPTALLTVPANPYSGSYTGTVTQTLV